MTIIDTFLSIGIISHLFYACILFTFKDICFHSLSIVCYLTYLLTIPSTFTVLFVTERAYIHELVLACISVRNK